MPETQEEKIERFAKWAAETCLLFGAEVGTAYLVGAEVAAGLDRDLPPASPSSESKHEL